MLDNFASTYDVTEQQLLSLGVHESHIKGFIRNELPLSIASQFKNKIIEFYYPFYGENVELFEEIAC